MALVVCKGCGKQISDRTKFCPACGTKNEQEAVEVKKDNVCKDCGNELPPHARACPNCGCPVEGKKIEPIAVPVLDPGVSKFRSAPDPKRKKRIIAAILALLIVVGGVFAGIKISNNHKEEEARRAAKKAAKEYEENLSEAVLKMLEGAAKAESSGNLIKSVWYNSIYEVRDTETDPFTRPNGYFVSDFNQALRNLFSNSSFSATISEIEANQEEVADLMKKMKNPPDEYEDAYAALQDLYDAYLTFTNLVTDPSGSLQTFSANYNDAHSAFLTEYNAMEVYTDN